jgi:hypothetical protein
MSPGLNAELSEIDVSASRYTGAAECDRRDTLGIERVGETGVLRKGADWGPTDECKRRAERVTMYLCQFCNEQNGPEARLESNLTMSVGEPDQSPSELS